MPRRILPVPSSFPLARLVALCRVAEPLGVWLEAARPPVRFVVPGPGGRRLLLLSADLGTALALAPRVVVWDGRSLRTLGARALGRARRVELGAETASVVGAVAGSASGPEAASRSRITRHPIDCVGEGSLA